MLKFVNKEGTKVMEMADNGDVKINGAFVEKMGEMSARENVSIENKKEEKE